jgi:putative transposase
MMPHDLPPWQSVYGLYNRWRQDGTWERIHEQLRSRLQQDQSNPSPSMFVYWIDQRRKNIKD